MKRPLFSLVVPIYQNELDLSHSLPEFLLIEKQLGSGEVEIILVEDGSSDSSYEISKEFLRSNTCRMKLIKLSRNFGQIPAIQAGLRYASGKCVGIISADLQDPPELFLDMIEEWRRGYKLVMAERIARAETKGKRLMSQLFWHMVSLFALKGYPKNGFDFCLVDRELVDIANTFTERNTHIFPLLFSLGFKQTTIPYKRGKRRGGQSQWTLLKKMKLGLDTFIAFSYTPIRIISMIGTLIAGISFTYGTYVFASYLLFGNPYSGWSSLAVLSSGLSGLTLLTLGIIGEYLWRILDAVRARPHYIVESVTMTPSARIESISPPATQELSLNEFN